MARYEKLIDRVLFSILFMTKAILSMHVLFTVYNLAISDQDPIIFGFRDLVFPGWYLGEFIESLLTRWLSTRI